MNLEDYFENGNLYVWEETYAVVKSSRPNPNAFANIADKDEITVVIDQEKVRFEDAIEIEKDWRIITFDVFLPFGLVGFLAKISEKLAAAGVSLFVISSYSTDHVLVKQKDLDISLEALGKLGFNV